MTAKAADKLKSDGWKIVETSGFLHLIGPLWHRVVDGEHEYALLTEDKHHNRRGLVQGGVQSLSRSLFGRLVPEGKSAEYFGFYNMVGKFGTVLGPLLMGGTALAFGSTRASILALLLLFVGGGLLLWRVRFEPVQPPVSGQAAGSSR